MNLKAHRPYKIIRWCKTSILKIKKYLKEMQLMGIANCFQLSPREQPNKNLNLETCKP